MGLARGAIGWLLVFLLTTSLVVGNAVIAGQRTVLDAEFTKEALAEEDAYGQLLNVSEMTATEAGDAMPATTNESNGTSASSGLDSVIDVQSVISQAIPESYVRAQVEANIDRAYAYLHGERKELELYVETGVVKSRIESAVEAELSNASVDELLSVAGGEGEVGPLNASLVGKLTANESGYQSARTQFRAEIREQVVASLVDRTFSNASNDELLDRVIEDYDPDNYSEAEKAQMVDDQEPEIRDALATTVENERDDEVDDLVAEQLQTIAERETKDGSANASGDGAAAEMQAAALDVQSALVAGLTSEMSYGEFDSKYTDAKTRLAKAGGALASEELAAELPDRVSLTEQMGSRAKQDLQTAANVVQTLDKLAIVLLVASFVLLGLLWFVHQSLFAVGRALGKSLLVAGAPTYLSVTVLQNRLGSLLGPMGPGENSAFVGVMQRVFETVATQSLVLAVAGIAIYVLVFLGRRGWLPGPTPE